MFDAMRKSDAFGALLTVSRRLGLDPLQVQGPGGNTSLKHGDAMWIKASGTWLAEAGDRDIMVPCNVGVLRAALAQDAVAQPDQAEVVPAELNPLGLRSSIETAVHAALDWPVVLHTHCVATIAMAIRRDGPDSIADILSDLDVAVVPYVKPGWDLAKAIHRTVRPETKVVILCNHGLVVCGDAVAPTEALLRIVSARLQPNVLAPPIPESDDLAARLAGTGWRPAPSPAIHAVARDPERLAMAAGATLYPDHLIFLGPGCVSVGPNESLDVALTGPPRKILLFPGEGAAVPEDASPAVLALAQCLGDVLARVPVGADLQRFTPDQEVELLDWDAEKYRQSLNQGAQ